MSKSREWFEEFFTGLYQRVLGRQFTPEYTQEQADVVRRLLRVRAGQRVLDVPCGMGRLTIPLARSGLAMTGVDLTAPFLTRARRAARDEGLDIRFVRSDMREIDFDAEFHAALNWFGSFGYFSDDDNLAFARRVFRSLRPGGRFLVEGVNRSWLLARFRPADEQTIGRVRVDHQRSYDPDTKRVEDQWTLTDGRRTERRRVSIRLYNGTELRALLKAAGFRDIELFAYPGLGRFTRHSRRLIAVARRPKT